MAGKRSRMFYRVLSVVLLLSLVASAEPWPQLPATVDSDYHVELSPKGSYVLLNGLDVQVWDARTFTVLKRFRNLNSARGEFSPDDRHMVLTEFPATLSFYDCKSDMRKVWEFRGGGQVVDRYEVLFSPDGRYLLAVGVDGGEKGDTTVRVFETSTGRVVFKQPGWGGRLLGSLANFGFSPDSKSLLRSAKDKLQRYALPSGKKDKEIRLGGEMWGMTALPQGVLVDHYVEGGSRRVERLYTYDRFLLAGEHGRREEFPTQAGSRLNWRRDGGRLQVAKGENTIYTGSENDTLRYWVPGGGFVVGTAEEKLDLYDGEGRKLTSLPPITVLAGKVGFDCNFHGMPGAVYDLLTGKELARFAFASGMAVSDDGGTVAVATKKGVYLMDVPASRRAGVAVARKTKE